MRILCGLLVWTLFSLSAGAQDDKVLTPTWAATMVNKDVTMEFVVASTGRTKAGDKVFLNTEADHKSEKNFTVLLTKRVLAELKKNQIADPAAHYRGKKLQVYGTVKLFKEKPEIIVEKAGQLVEVK